MISIIVGILIIVPLLGIREMNELVKWLVKINSICMPLRYLWVFIAYIALKNSISSKNINANYHFIQNKTLGKIVGGWCFLLTAASCIMGIYSPNKFELVINIIVPLCLLGLGAIMPLIANKHPKN